MPPFSENLAVFEIERKIVVESDRPQMRIEKGECALHCGYLRLQTRNSECVILTALPCEQWLRERLSVLRFRSFPVLFAWIST